MTAAPRPFVSIVNARADEFLQPLPLKNSRDHWRPRPPTVDLTKSASKDDDDSPVVIQRPQAFPTFHSGNRAGPTGFTTADYNDFIDLTEGRKLPPTFSIPGGGAISGVNGIYHGTYVDHEKTTESIKELLEGINDSPPVKKKKGKKKEKKVDDELAAMMEEKATLSDGVKEEEEEEDEEEEESDVVDGLNISLLPHQIRGLKFLRNREEGKARGGILADDVWTCSR